MKKLHRNSATGMFSGVFSGLSESIGIDVAILRVAFILIAMLSGYLLIASLIYCVLLFILPDRV